MYKLTNKIYLVLFIFIINTGIQYAGQGNYERKEDVIYGRKDGMALTMDVFSPEKPNGIGVVLLISGGWFSSHNSIDEDWIPDIEMLINRGITVFAVVHSSMPEYKIPAIEQDVARAVKYIKYHAKEWNVNPARIGITGHSSGGQLSLMTAINTIPPDTSSKDPVDRESSAVGAVACFYPPTDFLYFGPDGADMLSTPRFRKFLPAFVNNPDDIAALKKVAEEVSPIRHVTSSMVPVLIIAGSDDKLVPVQQSKNLIEKLKSLNIPCELNIMEGKDHGWPNIAKDYSKIADWYEKYLPANK
jgi:acetyl esterase/lipase